MDGGLNLGAMWAMLRPLVERQMASLPQEVQQAFHATGIYITRQDNEINVEIRFPEGDEVAHKVKDFIISSFMGSLPELGKLLGVRVFVKKQ